MSDQVNSADIAERYAVATDWKPIEPGSCALCGHKPDMRPKTILEFCAWWRITKSTFYEWKDRGCAPVTVKIGGKVLITHEAEKEWRQQLKGGLAGLNRSESV